MCALIFICNVISASVNDDVVLLVLKLLFEVHRLFLLC